MIFPALILMLCNVLLFGLILYYYATLPELLLDSNWKKPSDLTLLYTFNDLGRIYKRKSQEYKDCKLIYDELYPLVIKYNKFMDTPYSYNHENKKAGIIFFFAYIILLAFWFSDYQYFYSWWQYIIIIVSNMAIDSAVFFLFNHFDEKIKSISKTYCEYSYDEYFIPSETYNELNPNNFENKVDYFAAEYARSYDILSKRINADNEITDFFDKANPKKTAIIYSLAVLLLYFLLQHSFNDVF